MAYVSTHPLFRSLTDEEEAKFREYARKNNPPNYPDLSGWEVYHPVCREEWMKRGIAPRPEGGKLL